MGVSEDNYEDEINGVVFLVKRTEIADCFYCRLDLRLHCSAEIREEIAGRAYTVAYNVIVFMYFLSIQMTGFLTAIVSPIVRFTLLKKKPTFVIRPLWYPVDVMASRRLFWLVFIYEATLVFHTVLLFSCFDFLYLHFMITTSARFDTLCQYLAKCYPFVDETEAQLCTTFVKIGKKVTLRLPPSKRLPRKVIDNLRGARLKKGIDDWNVLWRHSKKIHSICVPSANMTVVGGVATITMMTFFVVHEFSKTNKSEKAFDQSVVFLFYGMSGLMIMFILHYTATFLQNSCEGPKAVLWNGDWYKGGLEYKKLIRLFFTRLDSPLKMKVLHCSPVDLRQHARYISKAASYIAFLLQLSRQKSNF